LYSKMNPVVNIFMSFIALSLHGIMLEASERPLNVKFAEEQHSKRDKFDKRFNLNKPYREMGILGGRGGLDPRMLSNPYGTLTHLNMGIIPPPSPGSPVYTSRAQNMRYSPQQYQVLAPDDRMSWMNGNSYSAPPGQLPSPQYPPQYLGHNYGRSPENLYGLNLGLSMPGSRGYGYSELASLRISE
jgi:hypothetical protein